MGGQSGELQSGESHSGKSHSNAGVVDVRLDHENQTVHVAHSVPLVSEPVARHGSIDDPQTWVRALEALADSPDFAGAVADDVPIRIRASEIGMVGLDDAGRVIHPVLWASDERSRDDATWCRKKHDDAWWEREVGLVPESRHLVTKLSWLHRSEPDVWSRIQRICSLEDFVIGRLTASGPNAPIVSRREVVAEFGVWSPMTGTYSAAVLTLIDGQRDWSGVFPDVRSAPRDLGIWRDRRISG